MKCERRLFTPRHRERRPAPSRRPNGAPRRANSAERAMQPTLSTTRERRLACRRLEPHPSRRVSPRHHLQSAAAGRLSHRSPIIPRPRSRSPPPLARTAMRQDAACSSVGRAPAKATVAAISAEIEMAGGGDVEGGNGQVPRKAFRVIASTDAPAVVARGEGGDEAAEVRAVAPHSCRRRAPREAQLCRRRRTSAEQAATGHHRTNAAAGGPAWLQMRKQAYAAA